MRILIAPDSFGGTMSAYEAANAIAAGWSRARNDGLVVSPLSDGGPGFLEALAATLDGRLKRVVVRSATGAPVTAQVLFVGETAYVESAQACGLHLVPPSARDPLSSDTFGVGELISAALAEGVSEIVVGLGGSATNDGGSGMLAALGADIAPRGAASVETLGSVQQVDLRPVISRLVGVRLVAATDVDNPLLGANGASLVFGPQKGASADQITQLEATLTHWSSLPCFDQDLRHVPGAGAAGGLGFALFALGATRQSGIRLVMDAVGFVDRLKGVDVVITGEGSLDGQSLRGKVVHGVASASASLSIPCLVLAGQVKLAAGEVEEAGIAAAFAVTDLTGSLSDALANPAERLSDLAEHVARTTRF